MSTLPASVVETLATNVRFDEYNMIVDLADGRAISVPLAWFPRLFDASPKQRDDYELIGRGQGIHWEALDEDLSVIGLLRGR